MCGEFSDELIKLISDKECDGNAFFFLIQAEPYIGITP